MAHTGAYHSSDPRAAAQAASIGATIGPDGWWYKNGQRMTHDSADQGVNDAGTGAEGQEDFGTGHGTFSDIANRNKIGGVVGSFWEHNKKDLAAIAATVAAGGNPLAGAAVKAGWEGLTPGSNFGDILRAGVTGYGAGAGANAAKSFAQGALKNGIVNTAKGLGKQAVNKLLPGVTSMGANQIPEIKPQSEGGPDLTDVANADKRGVNVPDVWGGAYDPNGNSDKWGNVAQNAVKKYGPGLLPGPSPTDRSGSPLDFLKDPTNLLGLAQGFNAANLQKQSTDYAKGAFKSVNDNWNANDPLRTAGRAGMLNPQLPDLSALDAIRTQGNPFARSAAAEIPSVAPAVPSTGASSSRSLPQLTPMDFTSPTSGAGRAPSPNEIRAVKPGDPGYDAAVAGLTSPNLNEGRIRGLALGDPGYGAAVAGLTQRPGTMEGRSRKGLAPGDPGYADAVAGLTAGAAA